MKEKLHTAYNFITFWVGIVVLWLVANLMQYKLGDWSDWISIPLCVITVFILAYIWVGSFWKLEKLIFGHNRQVEV